MPTLEDIRLGQLAVAQGLAQPLEIEECLADQHRNEQNGKYEQLGEILINQGFITRTQLERLLSTQREAVQKVTRIGHYELIRKLGEGGMGAVYQAKDTRTNDIVALKVLPRSKARDETFLQRFESEARASFEVDHPNIIRGLDVDQADGYHFIVMEFVDGDDIYNVLEAKGRFPEPEALHILIQITSALDHIHEERLVHRDIKPENILITENGQAKLADMGLAVDKHTQSKHRITKTGIAMGTPFYLSPEQIQGKSEIDIRSDIYSLGATGYEMVTGRPPFDGENSTAVMMQHLNDSVPSPREVDRDISFGFCQVLEKMMAKDPAERYQTPSELLTDLNLVAEGKMPLSVRPPEGRSSISRPQNEPLSVAKGTRRGSSVRHVAVSEEDLKRSSSVRRASSVRKAVNGPKRSQTNTQLPRFRNSAYPRSSSASIRWAILAGIFVALFAMILILLANLFGNSGSG